MDARAARKCLGKRQEYNRSQQLSWKLVQRRLFSGSRRKRAGRDDSFSSSSRAWKDRNSCKSHIPVDAVKQVPEPGGCLKIARMRTAGNWRATRLLKGQIKVNIRLQPAALKDIYAGCNLYQVVVSDRSGAHQPAPPWQTTFKAQVRKTGTFLLSGYIPSANSRRCFHEVMGFRTCCCASPLLLSAAAPHCAIARHAVA